MDPDATMVPNNDNRIFEHANSETIEMDSIYAKKSACKSGTM